jgi:hypothetical protein
MIGPAAVFVLMLAVAQPVWAQFDKVLKGLGGLGGIAGGGLSDAKIGSGLQEALKVGTENAVVQTGAVDGFCRTRRSRF